jgi:2-polyprenyl-3-methyl-5-hydroxy-6-metoxy-1,4-benzoquinol methylase
MSAPRCRFCSAALTERFADLGMSPLSNSYLTLDQANAMEPTYPLLAWVCGECKLVQLQEFETPEQIFSDYAYFSSYSSSWLAHAERYVEQTIDTYGIGPESHVVELASNDGYLLQYFHQRGVPVLGIEPAANVAQVAEARGIRSLVRFFGRQTAREVAAERPADLLLGNNVLAHVPDLNDFVAGMKILLAPAGVITMEFPHLMRLIDDHQFDTIYHEHFSYFSFMTVSAVFAAHGLRLFDVEELPTHGGSLRIHGCHDDDARSSTARAAELLDRERAAGYGELDLYRRFAAELPGEKRQIVSFLMGLKEQGLALAGYGAPAKGNTLLNFCGLRTDVLDYTVDMNPHKQGHLLPGSHIPIRAPEALRETCPDVVVILPWNLRDEITAQHAYVREWGGRFAARAPDMRLLG